MQLSVGTRLGPYHIDAPIGAGGMGEVYRATDTRLDRSVAIKILSAEFASDPALLARFEREAKTISSLNHSHICALYDIGETNGQRFLVMEYLEGESLADRLMKGALPSEQVLRIGIEIADALDKAHRRGIIHRDLKPANVMLTKSGAKLLEFVLSKSVAAGVLAGPAAGTAAATQQKALTQEGTLVGTFQYMAPEQLEGQTADTRSDIFALGAMLYEMATGRRAFDGKSRASIIAAILDSEPPPISELRPMAPPALDRVIRTCLAKDPEERWQTAHDVMLQLRWIAEGGSKAGVAAPVAKRRLTRERLAWSLLAVATLVAIGLATGFVARTPTPAQMVHFSIETPQKASLFPFDERGIALSPDGSRLAFVASEAGRRLIYLRPVSSNSSQPLSGTEDGSYPFWSPDGQSIGFFAAGKLKKISAAGGPPQVICDAPSGRGGTWNEAGVILFSPTITSALFRVPSGGGTPIQVTSATAPEVARQRWPLFLPDGKHFLFTGVKNLHLGSLDSKETKTLIEDASNAQFAPPDRLLYSRGEILMTQKFNLRKLTVVGEPVALALGSVAHWVPKQLTVFSASRNGTLAFLPAPAEISRLIWTDRNGREIGSVGEPGRYMDAALSPDGKRIAVVKGDPKDADIWMVDVADGRWSRFTFRPGNYGNLTWNKDGSMLAFFFDSAGVGQPFVKTLSRDADATQVADTKEWAFPFSFSPDGSLMLIGRQMPSTGFDVFTVTLDGKATMKPILQTPFAESHARLSPNGKWLAYDSNESSRTEVYVRRFPPTADQWQVSVNGGIAPIWRADGRELFYFGSDSVMAVPMDESERLNPRTPVALFRDLNLSLSAAGPIGSVIHGVTKDGQRFLLRPIAGERFTSLNVVLNWQSALR
jgi:serine/threonine protein kinase